MEEQQVETYEEGAFLNTYVSPGVWLNNIRVAFPLLSKLRC